MLCLWIESNFQVIGEDDVFYMSNYIRSITCINCAIECGDPILQMQRREGGQHKGERKPAGVSMWCLCKQTNYKSPWNSVILLLLIGMEGIQRRSYHIISYHISKHFLTNPPSPPLPPRNHPILIRNAYVFVCMYNTIIHMTADYLSENNNMYVSSDDDSF